MRAGARKDIDFENRPLPHVSGAVPTLDLVDGDAGGRRLLSCGHREKTVRRWVGGRRGSTGTTVSRAAAQCRTDANERCGRSPAGWS